jgi:type II secretory pathway component PulK
VTRRFESSSCRRRGAILVAAIVVVFALAGMVLVLCRRMSIEAIASANQAAAVQASGVERGGEQYVLGVLVDTTESPLTVPEEDFQAVQVGQGYFWVIRPDYGDSSLPLWGVVDESAKADINYTSAASLLELPGMTDDVAAAIVDWRDPDDNESPSGAESQYYLSLPDPYTCKNGPFETVEELLLIRGVTPQLLYGDGSAPPAGSSAMSQSFGAGASFNNPQLARGIYDLLTVYSSQPNTGPDGSRRIDLNDRNSLRNYLNKQLGNSRTTQALNAAGRARFNDVFDFYFRTRLTRDEFDKVGDSLSTSTGTRVRGSVNVNTAPAEVLLTLPGLDSADVDKLMNQRPAPSASNATSITWVADALGPKSVGLGSKIIGKSTRYSADVLGVSGNGRAFKRCRIVVDISGSTPRVVYRRDLSDRGWPLDPQILESLRTGDGPGGGGLHSGGLFK